MPTYDYQCRSCGTVIEVIHPMTEDGPAACEVCGGQLRRVLYPTGIIFKGSGFYSTDSRSGSSSSATSAPAKPSSDGPASTDSKKPAAGSSTDTKAASSATGDASS